MTKKIEEMLEEIFLVDPDLKKHEEDLKKIILDFVEQKPDTKFDEAFKEELRLKLLEKAEELIELRQKKHGWFKDLFVPRNLSFALAGATLSLLIAIPVFISFTAGGESFKSVALNQVEDDALFFKSEIRNLSNNAFGTLGGVLQNESLTEKSLTETSDMNLSLSGRGAGGALSGSEADKKIEPMMMDSSKMIMPYNAVEYEYIYRGEDFKLNNDALLVYKKVLNESSGRDASVLLKKFDFDIVNLDQFKNAQVKQISLAEEKEFGFRVNINFESESISIYQNWNKWPRPDKDCRDEACFQKHRLQPSDVPDDKKIISIADDFVKKLGVDMTFYDKALVQNYWKDSLTRKTGDQNVWVPEEITVVYPLKFNDQIVYDSFGNVNGLNVNVNIRHMRVSGIHNLGAEKYESSEYQALTDPGIVIEELKKGGFMNRQWYREDKDASRKIVQVELGEPTLDLVKYHKYRPESREAEQLFVPALIFPVENLSDDEVYYNRKAIIVPLIEEILEENSLDAPIGIPEPMPLN